MTPRQMEIVELVKRHAPVTGEQIAEFLGLSRPTIRSDLAVLVMLGYIDAKPKVGYFLGKAVASRGQRLDALRELKVKDYQSMPVVIRETATVNDAVVALFLEDVGSLTVADAQGGLVGVVSRKDLLKVTLGNPAASSMLVSFVMTRQPNIVTVTADDPVLEAGRRMIQHQVDSLPVVSPSDDGHPEVVGRITKTTMTRILLELGNDAQI